MKTISSNYSKVDNKPPLISVIVPVYNVEHYLARCIDSILNQDYPNLEVILVDDGSTDSSWEICQKYKNNDKRIIIKQQVNAGSSVARNTGLTLAKGSFIAFVDSDDYITKEMLSTMVSYAIRNNLEVVECSFAKSSEPFNSKTSEDSGNLIETREEAMERLIKEKNWSVWRRIYRTEVLKGLTFIPGKIHQDVFFTIDVIDKIDRQGYIPSPLYIYNTENESITRSAYNLKKLDAKDAPYYLVQKTQSYNDKVKTLANNYLIKVLLSHYDRLFSHSYLDKDFSHRKLIKKEITTQLATKYKINSTFAVLAKFLPIWLYGWIMKINELRIKVRLILLKV